MNNRFPLYVLIAFALIYASVSLVNHFLFRTYALDLGLYTNALYDYSHFQWNDSSSFREVPANLLSDHFDLLLFLIAPFSFVFKSWTLLCVQWMAVTVGGYAFYLYFNERFKSSRLACFAMLFYYCQFAVFTALGFDYHSNVVAAALVPWFLLCIERGQLTKACIVLFLIFIAKENMSLWMFFLLSGMAVLYRSGPVWRYLLGASIVALLYFILITAVVMPSLDPSGRFVQFNYSILGAEYSSTMSAVLDHPVRLVQALFRNHLGVSGLDGVKEEWWKFFLLSGGAVLLYRPVYLWMLLPVFFQKMWSDRTQTWGVNDHYSIELLPVLVWGVFMVIGQLRNSGAKTILMPLMVGLALFSAISIMDRTVVFLHREQLRIYQDKHWVSAVNRKSFDEIIALIPDSVPISTQSCLHPRMAWRDKCYCYPLVKDASMILVTAAGDSYPLDRTVYSQSIDTLKHSQYWTLKAEQDGLLLFERK